ncbi:MAG: hypothetical protein ACR2FU_03640 [Streptosporangiaceae bacterium]
MPCYRCGTRQTDPDRGSSPWLRGVLAERQVLICPGCQGSGEWITHLDRCPVCASARLVRRLGETECRECGHVGESVAVGSATQIGAGPDLGGLTAPGLADEVEQALARVLRPRSSPRRPRPDPAHPPDSMIRVDC